MSAKQDSKSPINTVQPIKTTGMFASLVARSKKPAGTVTVAKQTSPATSNDTRLAIIPSNSVVEEDDDEGTTPALSDEQMHELVGPKISATPKPAPPAITKLPPIPPAAAIKAKATATPTITNAAPQLDSITEASLDRIAAEVSERNRHFRRIGWTIAFDGTLVKPRNNNIVPEQTGVDAKVCHQGAWFYLDVGPTREHNELIKQLGGHWKQYKRSWQFDSASIDKVRGSFNITNEEHASSSSAAFNSAPRPVHRNDGTIKLEKIGDYIIIRGDTKPIKDDLKVAAPGLKWDAEAAQWIANTKHEAAITALLEELKESGRVTSYEFVED